MVNKKWLTYLCGVILVAIGMACGKVNAGKHAYEEFQWTIGSDIDDILASFGLGAPRLGSPPKRTENPRFHISAVPGKIYVSLHDSGKIPPEALGRILEYLIRSNAVHGRSDEFHVKVYSATHLEWRNSLFLGIGAFKGSPPHMIFDIYGKR
jgi:hypothetical protein